MPEARPLRHVQPSAVPYCDEFMEDPAKQPTDPPPKKRKAEKAQLRWQTFYPQMP